MKTAVPTRWHSFTLTTESVVRGNTAHFDLRHVAPEATGWLLMSVGVELRAASNDRLNFTVVTVLYHDLGARLPSLKRAVEYK